MNPRIKQPRILFVSALDFKERSIQVIRKTPEAFRDAGWKVTYLVLRDTSLGGDYSYEGVVDISGVRVVRALWPLPRWQDRFEKEPWNTVVSKLRGYLAVLRLASRAASLLAVGEFDVIYGYEAHGYLAVCLLRLLGLTRGAKIVARFQGFKSKSGLMAFFNWEMFLALLVPAHLCIMTDDGTQGDRLMRKIGSPNSSRLKFWVNGVDPLPKLTNQKELRRRLGCPADAFLIVSISRLVPWKRVDRGIMVMYDLVNRKGRKNVRYFVIGGGIERDPLQRMVDRLSLAEHIRLLGPMDNQEALKCLQAADAFISAYDLSNVGNPLLEAIRAGLPIFTLDNGDTARWIKHGYNGFIYPPDDSAIGAMATDIVRLMDDRKLRAKIREGLGETERKRLWTWRERLKAEVETVRGLVTGGK